MSLQEKDKSIELIKRKKDAGRQQDIDAKEKIIPPASYNEEEFWVREYKEQFGTEPSFF